MSSAYIQLLLSSHKLHKNEGVQRMIPVVFSASSFVTRFTTSGGVFLSFYLYGYVPSHIILWRTPRGHRHVWPPIAPASPLSTFIASSPYPALGAAYLPWKLLRGRRTLPSPQLLPSFLHRKSLPCGWTLLSESVARAGPRPAGNNRRSETVSQEINKQRMGRHPVVKVNTFSATLQPHCPARYCASRRSREGGAWTMTGWSGRIVNRVGWLRDKNQ